LIEWNRHNEDAVQRHAAFLGIMVLIRRAREWKLVDESITADRSIAGAVRLKHSIVAARFHSIKFSASVRL